jgi:hypothetical protein
MQNFRTIEKHPSAHGDNARYELQWGGVVVGVG